MPGPLGSFIDDFNLLINELSTQHRMLIVGDSNLHQMLPKDVAKVYMVYKYTNSLTWGNIESGIWYLKFQYCFFFASAYSDQFVFFFNPHYINHK